MKDINWFSGLLFVAGLYSLFYVGVNFHIANWMPYLFILALVIFLDLFPMKFPSGIEYAAGSIGCLIILLKYGLAVCTFTFLISLFFCFVKKNKGIQNLNWFRYIVTLGMYYISFFISIQVLSFFHGINLYFQVFLASLAFEISNHLLLGGLKWSIGAASKHILKTFVPLAVAVFVYTFTIPNFLELENQTRWYELVAFIAVIAILIIYFSSSFLNEIENRKKVEKALRETQQELLDTIRHQQGMTFKFKKENGRFIHTLNDGELLYRMGVFPEQVIGKELRDFLPIDHAIYNEQFYRRAWQGEENVTYEAELNGITYLASLRPIKRDGKVVEVIASCVDITHRKKAEELLLKSEKLAVAGQLAAGVAHEVRNPLATVRGMVQLLRSGIVKDQYFQLILSEIDRMDLIIKEFLVLAKPYPTVYQQLNIHVLIEKVIILFEAEKNMKNIDFTLGLHAEDLWIMGDENQLKQVFINIIKNAFEAMPCGGVIQIQTEIESSENIRVRIKDNGCGIPEERLSKIGEPFYSTKEKGTGLGLMVSYKIIQEHNGTFYIQSALNQGTIVSVVFPLVKGASEIVAKKTGSIVN